jgi:hypothetical protein
MERCDESAMVDRILVEVPSGVILPREATEPFPSSRSAGTSLGCAWRRSREANMSEAAKKRNVVVRLKLPQARKVRGHRTGILVGRDERGALVDYPGNPHGVLVARSTVSFDGVSVDAAARRQVLLVFEQERSDDPIIVGFLEPRATGRAPAPPPPSESLETKVDGRRVVLEAQDEIELRCGEASITLRRNGRVVIRGAYVETRSRGVNRIKGGAVQIN